MGSDIFRKKTCDICGAVEYKPYIGSKQFDGGYTTVNEFEPSDYENMRIGDDSLILCPDCIRKARDAIQQLKQVTAENHKYCSGRQDS